MVWQPYDRRVAAPSRQRAGSVLGLALACHPGPVLAVTAIATLLAITAGAAAGTVALLAAAFLVGQLSVGWSNDWVDAERDIAVARTDKPVASGRVSRASVGLAAVTAAAATVPLSLALGRQAGLAHLALVISGWAYNAGLKGTAWSWLPYAVAFGLLPAVVTLALPGRGWAPTWAMAAGAFLGIGAHLVNVLPDLDDDRATGVNGLPHRLGRKGCAILAPIALVSASALVVAGPPGRVGVGGATALAAAATAAIAGSAAGVRGGHRMLALLLTASVAVIDVVLLLASGASLLR